MTIKAYYASPSPPARAVILMLKALNVPYEGIAITFENQEHKYDDYLKMNPQGTVPTLIDDDFVVVDSHAINIYLVSKYDKEDKWYPKDIKARSIVNHRLFFDASVIFPAILRISKAIFVEKIAALTQKMIDDLTDGYKMLEKFLEKSQYIAGNTPTIADISVMTTVANATIFKPIKKETFPRLFAYMELCEPTFPGYAELTNEGLNMYREFFHTRGNPDFQLPVDS